MKPSKNLPLLVLCLLTLQLSQAQFFSEKYISSLLIEENDSLIFTGDSLYIDTLRMHDHAKLKFISNTSYIFVRNAYIGIGATIDGSGDDGRPGTHGSNRLGINGTNGGHGLNGKHLFLIMTFKQLGSIYITTDGGQGGKGGNGYSPKIGASAGDKGFDGGDAGHGGHGKDAGDVTFYYGYEGFIPAFNRDIPHSIHLSMKKGNCGDLGIPGRGGPGGGAKIVRDPITHAIIYAIPAGTRGIDGVLAGGCFEGKKGDLMLKNLNGIQ